MNEEKLYVTLSKSQIEFLQRLLERCDSSVDEIVRELDCASTRSEIEDLFALGGSL